MLEVPAVYSKTWKAKKKKKTKKQKTFLADKER